MRSSRTGAAIVGANTIDADTGAATRRGSSARNSRTAAGLAANRAGPAMYAVSRLERYGLASAIVSSPAVARAWKLEDFGKRAGDNPGRRHRDKRPGRADRGDGSNAQHGMANKHPAQIAE